MLPHQEVYREGMRRFTAAHRRLEWLAVRVLLYTLSGEEKEIAYHPSGKPYLADDSASLSISHTKGYVAVVLGLPGREVGVDIEQYGERVRKVHINSCAKMNSHPCFAEPTLGHCCCTGRLRRPCSNA